MSKFIVIFFSLLLSTFFIVSCYDSKMEDVDEQIFEEEEKEGTEYFIYKGIVYDSYYYLGEDGKKVFTNEEFVNIASYLSGLNGSIIAVVENDGIIQYFDSIDEIKNIIDNGSIETRSTVKQSWLHIWLGEKCSGSSFYIHGGYIYNQVTNLLAHGTSNTYKDFTNTSSFKMKIWNSYVRFYDQINCQGNQIFFINDRTRFPNENFDITNQIMEVRYLKNYSVYPGGPNWDNRIKSLDFLGM